MRTHQLVYILRVNQVADLTARIHPMKWLTSQCVPEAYAPIRSATTAADGAVLVRVPRDGLDCRHVLCKLYEWLLIVSFVPDHELVVVAS